MNELLNERILNNSLIQTFNNAINKKGLGCIGAVRAHQCFGRPRQLGKPQELKDQIGPECGVARSLVSSEACRDG